MVIKQPTSRTREAFLQHLLSTFRCFPTAVVTTSSPVFVLLQESEGFLNHHASHIIVRSVNSERGFARWMVQRSVSRGENRTSAELHY